MDDLAAIEAAIYDQSFRALVVLSLVITFRAKPSWPTPPKPPFPDTGYGELGPPSR